MDENKIENENGEKEKEPLDLENESFDLEADSKVEDLGLFEDDNDDQVDWKFNFEDEFEDENDHKSIFDEYKPEEDPEVYPKETLEKETVEKETERVPNPLYGNNQSMYSQGYNNFGREQRENPLYNNQSNNYNNNYNNYNNNYNYSQGDREAGVNYNQGYPNYNPNYNPNLQYGGFQQNGYNPYNQPQYQQQPPKKKNTGLIIAIIALSLVICVLLFTLVIQGLMPKDSPMNDSERPSDTISQNDSEPNDTNSMIIGDNTDPNNSGLNLEGQPNISVDEYSAASAYNKIAPSVVAIQCFTDADKKDDSLNGEGSGVVVTENGYIITNSHVVGDTKKVYITVILSDGKKYDASVVGFDQKTDLAVVKIKENVKLVPASFANSDELVIGQEVAAVGNPGGIAYSNSLTNGIVSALNRSVENYSYVKYIQTNAAINPGNSGGPLVNYYGQVIGINTIKIADESYEGMGFAIPSNTVKKICDDLISKGYVANRVRIGITGQELTEAQAKNYNVPRGILIKGFASDSPFNSTDAAIDDIITAFNGVKVNTFSQLYTELDKYSAGDIVEVELYRSSADGRNDKTINVKIKLVADEGQTQQAMDEEN